MTVQEAPGGQEQQQQSQESQEGHEPKVYDEAYVEKLRQESAKYRTQRNEFKSQLESVRTEKMTPDEKMIAEAEQRGRAAAALDHGMALARTAFDAAAGRRNPELNPKDVEEILSIVDLRKFVGDDGKVNSEAIQKAAEKLVPAPTGRVPDFEGGQGNGTPRSTDMNRTIRKLAGFGQ